MVHYDDETKRINKRKLARKKCFLGTHTARGMSVREKKLRSDPVFVKVGMLNCESFGERLSMARISDL